MDLLLTEDEGAVLGDSFQPQEALVPGLEVVAQPDAADPGSPDVDSLQAQFVGDALGALSGKGQGVVQDLLFDLRRDPIRMRSSRSALFLYESRDASHLEGALDLVESVPVIAYDLAGLGDVAQFFSQLQQGE